MVNLQTERTLTIPQACRLLPTTPHPATMTKWIKTGKFEALKIGGRWITSVEAIERFAARCAPDSLAGSNQPNPSDQRQRDRSAAQAERECAAAGL